MTPVSSRFLVVNMPVNMQMYLRQVLLLVPEAASVKGLDKPDIVYAPNL